MKKIWLFTINRKSNKYWSK